MMHLRQAPVELLKLLDLDNLPEIFTENVAEPSRGCFK